MEKVWKTRFDEEFGKDGTPEEDGSIDGMAGCDDCFSNRETRRKHKVFVETTIAEERSLTREWIIGNIEDNDTKDKIVSYLSSREA